MRTLASGQSVADSVEGGAWRYFVTDTQPGQVLTWTVNSTGDCDLYVRHDSIPTRRDYDQNDIGLSTSFTLQAVNNRSRSWYTGVHGFTQCDYTLHVAVTGTPTAPVFAWLDAIRFGVVSDRVRACAV